MVHKEKVKLLLRRIWVVNCKQIWLMYEHTVFLFVWFLLLFFYICAVKSGTKFNIFSFSKDALCYIRNHLCRKLTLIIKIPILFWRKRIHWLIVPACALTLMNSVYSSPWSFLGFTSFDTVMTSLVLVTVTVSEVTLICILKSSNEPFTQLLSVLPLQLYWWYLSVMWNTDWDPFYFEWWQQVLFQSWIWRWSMRSLLIVCM